MSSYRAWKTGWIAAVVLAAGQLGTEPPASAADDTAPAMVLSARDRVKNEEGEYVVRRRDLDWNPRQTAIVVCDMWDDHYCRNAARRVAEMAPRMNEVLIAARKQGVLVIHCPSGCMEVYQDTPGRKLARQAPPVKTKLPLKNWCYLDMTHESELPIDDSVPCEDEKPRERKRFYSRQIETLKILDGDAITDSAEAYYLMRQRGIKNVIVMGVHTNMCVLGRPFGVRQMVYQGMNVALMRDMTDSMYNPRMAPRVVHCRGTELVAEHIEKHWCPTITSTDFTGQAAFRFAEDQRPKVVLIAGGGEYDADETMPNFAHLLRDRYGCDCQVLIGRGKGKQGFKVPGLTALKSADLMVLFVRRRALPKSQLDLIREYLAAGKPLVALRTTSHAFEVKDAPAGHVTWEGFDKQVLGCDYRGHGPNGTDVTVVLENASNAILTGVEPRTWKSAGSLYASEPVDPSATILLTGQSKNNRQPVAWTRQFGKGRVFYTSLGHPEDFQQPHFNRLLVNAVFWAMDKSVPAANTTGE